MLQSDDEFELLDVLLSEKTQNTTNLMCPMCNRPFENICYECGAYFDVPVFEVNDLYNYNKKPHIIYQKLTHFKEVLNNFQGRECKMIPQHVYDTIVYEMRGNIDLLNHFVLKSILKKHKFTKYVENLNSILFTISGKLPPYIPKVIEMKLINYFKQIVNVFDLYKPATRINFFNYYYVLYKLLELMDRKDLLYHVPKLKSKHRILEHDKIWKCICNALSWEYKKTKPPNRQTGI
jgi:hypothetical protein